MSEIGCKVLQRTIPVAATWPRLRSLPHRATQGALVWKVIGMRGPRYFLRKRAAVNSRLVLGMRRRAQAP